MLRTAHGCCSLLPVVCLHQGLCPIHCLSGWISMCSMFHGAAELRYHCGVAELGAMPCLWMLCACWLVPIHCATSTQSTAVESHSGAFATLHRPHQGWSGCKPQPTCIVMSAASVYMGVEVRMQVCMPDVGCCCKY